MGFRKCLQFAHLPSEIFQYGARYETAFPAIMHFWRHLVNSGCRQSHGLSLISRPSWKDFSDAVAYKVDSPINKLQAEDERDTV